MRGRFLVVALAWSSVAVAVAAPQRIVVDVPAEPAAASITPILVLERCVGGCTIKHAAVTSATNNTSTIPQEGGSCADRNVGCTLSEFVDSTGASGAAADAEWAALLDCVREVYSPFAIEVTDVRPTSGTYHLAIAAGNPSEIGLGTDILGIAPLSANCSPIDNAITFSFANHHPAGDTDRVNTMCWTVTQESAHAFGLDHAFEFTDGRSTCNDPMTYRVDCGGRRFFRNHRAECGTYAAADCRCGGTQNSHQKLLSVFGAGESTVPPPEVALVVPNASSPMLGSVAGARAGSDRGVAKLQLVLNGSIYSEVVGARFGPTGQGMVDYTLPLPANLPQSKYTVVVRACDDLGLCTDTSPAFEAFKGVATGCTSSEACLANQTCDDGYCTYPAAVGEIGDECSYAQFCKSAQCVGSTDRKICTQSCEIGDACPADLSCTVPEGATAGVCFSDDSGGCCRVATSDTPWPYLVLPLGILALVTRRTRVVRRRA